MGLLDIFSGGSPEKIEEKADALVHNGAYGQAKIEYEKALARLDRRPVSDPGYRGLLEGKLRNCKESLARDHRRAGQALMAAGCGTDARELFELGLELTADSRLAADIRSLMQKIPAAGDEPEMFDFYEAGPTAEDDQEIADHGSDDEYFHALCNVLEDDERAAYHTYPDSFKAGFLALNRGDFDSAVELLEEAARAYPFGANYISLELATAQLNRGENETALRLLEDFLKDNPESLRAYYLMCEIFWERQAFGEARQLLSNCPASLADTLPIKMLSGETYVRAGQGEQAAAVFQRLLEDIGWDNQVAQALAGVYESVGRNEEARTLYGEIIGTCTGCGTRPDPLVKQRYAETSFAAGKHSTKILELYLELVHEDPGNRQVYYQRISRLYELQGNTHESRRFASFAKQAVSGLQTKD